MIIPEGAPASPCTERGADFAQLYQRHHAAVFAFAYRRTGDHMRAEDVAAQTFLQALQAYGRYEERGAPVTAWLLRIAANVVYEQARRERRGPQVVSAASCPAGWDSSPGGGACDWAERVERRAWIARHLATLSRNERRVVWLRYGEDWAIDAIAAEIGRSPGATKQALHRAIKALRARLAADIDDAVPSFV